MQDKHDPLDQLELPKTDLRSIVQNFGPGLILMMTGIGTSHLITAPAAGGRFEYALLWCIPVAYIFKYSERKHTIASRKYPDDVPERVKSDRVTRLVELQKNISTKVNYHLIGQPVEVLIEGPAKKSRDQWMGHTESNVTVVWNKQYAQNKPGDLVTVTVADVSASTLFGESVSFPLSLV